MTRSMLHLSLAAALLIGAQAAAAQAPSPARPGIAVAALAAGSGPAPVAAVPAQPRRLQLRSDLTLSRDLVSFGDLIAGLPPEAAQTPAFRAPALGETGTIQVARIVEAARGAGILASVAELESAGQAQVVVTRAARRIMASDIEEAVKTGLQERYGVDARAFALTIDGGAPSISVEPELTGEAVVTDLAYDARTRRLQARVSVPGSMALRLKPIRIAGQLVETIEVVVPRRAIARGETLDKADVLVERRPREGQMNDLIGDPRVAIDKVATRALMAGAPLRGGDLRREEIVAKGDLVTLVYESRGLTITMRGRAGEAGAMGDVVSVTNPQSKRVLHGTVSGPGRISIQAASAGRVASAP
ncbi:MAG TPA: flagellar basal body P-ring formation chaperone FlgA [Bosea sp. (in: a-proteobacteria)]|jgi:flagella basal body P-ring formation protein FlgA|uniref:flagellar basal body P-ring formation chaperone FlgA n=1 Tax=Bosea sp. (in: a-proteobacteria) TaxID=1871050 RepID=UPI002DDCB299|nr:flagellar basal body P-ring formation chaperone FlgA [Bosea sp. (in: a-proteobacteria)]HEV2553198.1 flagellar basal body P-ring formation chaperone FlgA [Bosea sp. (in: a-proteobacteria)]